MLPVGSVYISDILTSTQGDVGVSVSRSQIGSFNAHKTC